VIAAAFFLLIKSAPYLISVIMTARRNCPRTCNFWQ